MSAMYIDEYYVDWLDGEGVIDLGNISPRLVAEDADADYQRFLDEDERIEKVRIQCIKNAVEYEKKRHAM